MGLPPNEFADSNGWQSVGPQSNSTAKENSVKGQPPQAQVYNASDVAVSETTPLRGAEAIPAQAPAGIQDGPDIKVVAPLPPETPLAQLAAGAPFQNFTLFVIVLNGLWIGIDVEWNHPSIKLDRKIPDWVTLCMENAFCGYFTIEIAIRIIAFGARNARDKSFWFDLVLVLFMIIETWIMAIVDAIQGGGEESILAKFSCLRLMRLSRLARIMHSLPELLTLVRGILNAAKSVVVVFVLMLVLMYIFAIIFTAQIGDAKAPEHSQDPYWVTDEDPTAVQLFGSMGDSMMTLFTRGMLGDNLAETLQAIKDRGAVKYDCPTFEDPDQEATPGECREGGELWLMWVFILFMIISAFCLLNMLVGMLCEVIDGTAKDELQQNQVADLSNNILRAFTDIDCSGDDHISPTEWNKMKNTDKVRQSFMKIGFDDNQLNEQMGEIEEHLFGRLDKTKMLDDDGSWMPPSAEEVVPTSPTGQASGTAIPMEAFVSNILEIRPDHDASFLDLYVLQTRAERDELLFNTKLDSIEAMLQSRKLAPKGPVPAPGDSQTSIERIQTEEPNTGTDPWLEGLPTEVLFAELKHRATLQVNNSSSPAIFVD